MSHVGLVSRGLGLFWRKEDEIFFLKRRPSTHHDIFAFAIVDVMIHPF